MINQLRLTNLQKFLVTFTLLAVIFTVFGAIKAYAAAPSWLPADQGTILYNYDNNIAQPTPNCYTNPHNNPALMTWGSQAGDPSNDTSLTVNGSASNVTIQLNQAAFNCQRYISPAGCYYPNDLSDCGSTSESGYPTKVADYITGVSVSAGGGSVTGPVGSTLTTTTNSSSRYWDNSLSGFVYTPPAGGFYALNGQTVTIQVAEKNGVWWSGTPYCGADGSAASSPAPQKCPQGTVSLSFTINVTNPYNVQANVYTANPDGTADDEVPGVSFNTPCGSVQNMVSGASLTASQIATTNPVTPYNTAYYYGIAPPGTGYCVSINHTAYDPTATGIPGYDGPFTRPWNYGANSNYPNSTVTSNVPACPGGPFSNSLFEDHCSSVTYQCQVAYSYANPDACGKNDADRAVDAGIDFDYVAFVDECPPGSSPGCSPGNSPTNIPACSIWVSTSTGGTVPTEDIPFTFNYNVTNNADVTTMDFSPGNNAYRFAFSDATLGGANLTTPTFNLGPNHTTSSTFTTSSTLTLGNYNETMYVQAKDIYDGGWENLAQCAISFNVAAAPYTKVFGGDVIAGASSQQIGICYAKPSGVYGWNTGVSSNSNIGAGTTDALIATGKVNEFVSGQNILALLDPLTYANDPASTYGGDFNSITSSCASGIDYYQQASSDSTLPGFTNLGTAGSASYCPGAAVGGTYTIPVGTHIVVVSTGNVTISCNIAYASLAGITDTSQIPSFEIVVKGANLYINPPNPATGVVGVTKLAGNYVAETDTTGSVGGTLDDTITDKEDVCPGSDLTTDGSYNTCSADRLVIDGSFVANKLELYRTYGTLSVAGTSTSTDPYAAEEFDYSPINWLTPGNTSGLTVQSVTSLPPVL